MANTTDGVRTLVVDVLKSLRQPYSEDVTDEVCLAIEANPAFHIRYKDLAAHLRDWLVNNWIGPYTAELTGRKSGEHVPSKTKSLIQTYKKLRA